VLRGFANLKPKRLLVCNRDPAKAEQLARRFGGTPVPYERLDEHLAAADIVVSGTGAPHPIITRRRYEGLLRQRRYRPAFLIDIALPRDVEPAVGELENVYLYNLDDLQQVVAATHTQRTGSVDAARRIVTTHVEQFLAWQRAREMGPLIEQLQQRYHGLARGELDRTLNKLGENVTPEQRAHLEDLTRRIVNKLLHAPIQTLRSADNLHGPTTGYLHAMEKLFRLDADATNPPPTDDQSGEDRGE
jgi:glutamyl-tRNA reductase